MGGRPEPHWYGDCAVALPVTELHQRLAVAEAIGRALSDVEVRVGMASILIVVEEPDPSLLDRVAGAWLEGDIPELGGSTEGRVVELEVVYDGADLQDAATALGRTAEELVAAHQRQAWRVAMMGFAPGFGYLVPDTPEILPWHRLGRRATPRPAVPAGSVAVAAGMSAVYPAEMPGGWQLLGSCAARLFDPADERDPTLFRPGDVVRFRGRTP